MNLDPMDYFLLNATTGELHTARPLDREILPDATGIITLSVRVCVCLDCNLGSFNYINSNSFLFRQENLSMANQGMII